MADICGSWEEILSALCNRNCHSALGPDGVSISYLKNDLCVQFMHSFFNTCLQHGKVPSQWLPSIIQPIPKSCGGSLEPGDYRGTSIQSSVMKILCSILNNRISDYLECNQLLAEEQNGFRKGRSCQDHVFTLNTILEGRKSIGKSTFTCFGFPLSVFSCLFDACVTPICTYSAHIWAHRKKQPLNPHFVWLHCTSITCPCKCFSLPHF